MSVEQDSIKWEELKARHSEISEKLTSENLDKNSRSKYQKELSKLTNLLGQYKLICDLKDTLIETESELKNTIDEEIIGLFSDEISQLKSQITQEESSLDDLLFPADELDSSNIYLEIRAGAGGKEAALFASDLMRMYLNYALSKNWQVSIMSASETDLKGYKEVVMHIKGTNVYGELKRESGVHRVQRVPDTESSGRVHTSTVTVAVLPEIQSDDQFEISPSDLRIDVFRASGAGGQHVNTTDSAVRITHIPTGVVTSCQDERSQHKNKNKAMKALQSKLLTEQVRKQEAELSDKRKSLVGTGMRAEKVRTYNYPQNRVSDHQINLTIKKLDLIIEGDLSELIAGLQEYDRELRRKNSLEKI